VLNPLYNLVARAVVTFHSGLRHVFGNGGWSWALSIVLLTMTVRFVLVPLFVKQIKAQRTMQLMQPKIKEIKEKYKNDKTRQNQEIMRLQKEHGNPLLGCLPIVVQIPLFLALYHVLNGFAPKHSYLPYIPKAANGLSYATAESVAKAKIFGVSLSASFFSSKNLLKLVHSDPGSTKVLAVVLIVIMMVSTFVTQRQIFGRNSANLDSSQMTQQRMLLYLSPLLLGVFGFRMPIGVLIYWFTTNAWSMVQQYVVLRRMAPLGAAAPPPPQARQVQQRPKPGLPAAAGAAAIVAGDTPAVEPTTVEPPPARRSRTPGVPATEGPDLRAAAPRAGGGNPRPQKRRPKNARRGGRR
jgi:YidC/Oxa1 family membrane protein insertase